jgi:hypothetical protein
MFRRRLLDMDAGEFVSRVARSIGEKRLVLLIDGIGGISEQNLGLLAKLMSLDMRVVVSGKPGAIAAFKEACSRYGDVFRDPLDIVLGGLDFEEMKELVMKRVEFFGGIAIEPFNQSYLKDIYSRAGRCPRTMLSLCHEAAMKLSVDPDMVRRLKEESVRIDETIYHEGFEHEGGNVDKIEVIRNEGPSVIQPGHQESVDVTFGDGSVQEHHDG